MGIFDKTKLQSEEIFNQATAYVAEKFAQVGKVFTPASAYGQILSVISNLSTMILFFIEDSITELNMQTASRTQSIQGLARLAGHNATRAIAATGEISFKINKIPEMQGDQIIVPNFTRIKCVNNDKIYTLNLIDDQVRMNIGNRNTVKAQVIQGEIFSQIFTGDGTPLQSYVAVTKGSKLLDNFFVKVYVNGEKWRSYDSLYDIPRNAKGFLVKTGISGGIDIYFGNSNFGMMPGNGTEIRIEYLETGGEGGNILEAEDITFKWIDPGYSLTGDEVDLNLAFHVDMTKLITFGSNPEPTALTRLIAPLQSRSFVFANPGNYIVFLEKFNYFSSVDAFTTFDDAYLDDDNVIYLFLIPDINKRLTNNQNYFSVPLKYFTLTRQEQDKVLTTINESGSKIVTTVTKIINPVIKKYVMNVSLVIFEGYSPDVIKNVIIAQVSDYFLALRRRDLIPQSDLIKLIEDIEGVDSVSVSFLSQANEIAKKANPSSPLKGLDDMGDILIGKNELPLIRGGWRDRRGVYYSDGAYNDRASSISIVVKRTTKVDINTLLFQQNMKKIMKNK